ncbi:MAG: hypothetical protein COZ34_00505 [Candidatus Pacebacteria bacterium CG_4_10_14_3_um_filter_34_15]|nr:sugar transferase [Candidatus Paceibacterota bacterium]PIQ80728.1 MAG: hypothetical protein COV78_04005 [Candidatus Pacebacteria bacterium CG11_big_fil_rev_8_21_14_0_20_34_55]PIX81951.1 MAG: hypothetical protein COZ34_00505 [Candidatus Pacebacteria bacterium CG_4_10_14_3_um_filter_34_15]PJC43414.1 MAG: hypothetical protein CO039_04205 [Candidatus Pacebacteria bacterium CG_4_9_14_0_2_um_filter_34_50]
MSQYLVNPYYFSVQKRLFDIFFALLGLIILVPIFILAYPLFTFFLGRPFFFKQKRMGKNKKHFVLYKIRTMKIGSENQQDELRNVSSAPYPMFKVKNDPRFISIGKLFSNFGVDELPQLLNILKNDMSFVGPRPLPINEAIQLPSSWDFRYAVRPGILSKWALAPNRYDSLKTWKKLEKETLKSGSLTKDIKLIIKAIAQIIFKISP